MAKLKKKVVIVSLVVILIFGGILLWALWKKTEISRVEKPTSTPTSTPKVEKTPEPLKAGEIGEIKETETSTEVSISILPSDIFNTDGAIVKVEKDKLLVQGSGSNYTDQKPRELTLIFTDETITFEPGQKVKYRGFEGLNHLKEGDKISISSPENIRGKTQFKVDYINKF